MHVDDKCISSDADADVTSLYSGLSENIWALELSVF